MRNWRNICRPFSGILCGIRLKVRGSVKIVLPSVFPSPSFPASLLSTHFSLLLSFRLSIQLPSLISHTPSPSSTRPSTLLSFSHSLTSFLPPPSPSRLLLLLFPPLSPDFVQATLCGKEPAVRFDEYRRGMKQLSDDLMADFKVRGGVSCDLVSKYS